MRDPKEKFRELAAKRVNNVVRGMRSLAKLSNTKNYAYSETEVAKIMATLKAEVKVLEASFASKKPQSDFKL